LSRRPSLPALSSFDFAIIRVVPRVDRGECVNAGVILFCLSQKFLGARVFLDQRPIQALCPDIDLDSLHQHLQAFPKVCAGEADAGPIAALSLRERFHWLVAPRSTVIQISPVHSGCCDSPDAALDDLFRKLVLR
jgi:hypothetical protein